MYSIRSELIKVSQKVSQKVSVKYVISRNLRLFWHYCIISHCFGLSIPNSVALCKSIKKFPDLKIWSFWHSSFTSLCHLLKSGTVSWPKSFDSSGTTYFLHSRIWVPQKQMLVVNFWSLRVFWDYLYSLPIHLLFF